MTPLQWKQKRTQPPHFCSKMATTTSTTPSVESMRSDVRSYNRAAEYLRADGQRGDACVSLRSSQLPLHYNHPCLSHVDFDEIHFRPRPHLALGPTRAPSISLSTMRPPPPPPPVCSVVYQWRRRLAPYKRLAQLSFGSRLTTRTTTRKGVCLASSDKLPFSMRLVAGASTSPACRAPDSGSSNGASAGHRRRGVASGWRRGGARGCPRSSHLGSRQRGIDCSL